MSSLADDVLPLIRTRRELIRLGAANAHGRQMHEAIDILEESLDGADPKVAFRVADKALASAISVIARADDSSGIIGSACRRLLALHPRLAEEAAVPAERLVAWMIGFQFEGKVDFFTIDPVAYAPALGPDGMARYREALAVVRAGLGPEPDSVAWRDPHRHERWVLEHNDRRLAVLDRDVEAIIRTHGRELRVAAWYQDVAEALEEIGEIELAMDWARRGTDFDRGFQAEAASGYWCGLVGKYRPEQLLDASLYVFRRWPKSSTAARVYLAAGADWPALEPEVMAALEANPSAAVGFVLRTLVDPARAWALAHELELDDATSWSELVAAYEQVDPVAVLPVHERLVESVLSQAKAQNYRVAARRLAHMRQLAAGTVMAGEVDGLIAVLREEHRRRPRLQQEFDKARLP